MRITFVEPRIAYYSWLPLNLLYLSSYLKKKYKYEPVVIDTNPAEIENRICKQILDTKPDIIGITCTTPQFSKMIKIAEEIKKYSSVPIVVGGVHPSVCPEETLAGNCIDFIVIGEGEETFAELCEKLSNGEDYTAIQGIGYRLDGKIVINQKRERISNLDDIPFPAWDLLPVESYFLGNEGIMGAPTKRTINVITSRGCPFRCAFCNSSKVWASRVKRRSVDDVLEEIEYLRVTYQIDSIKFFDDCFTVKPAWVLEFCEKLIKKAWPDFFWECYSRVDLIKDNVVKAMKAAGCTTIHLGVESGSPRILNQIDKKISVEQIINAFEIIKRHNIRIFAFIVIGFPNETLDDHMRTENLLKEIRPDGIEVDFAIPFPGTKLFSEVVELGLIPKNVDHTRWFQVSGAESYHDKPIYNHLLTTDQLIKIKGRLQNLGIVGRYKPFLKNPKQFVKGLKIFFKGIHRLPRGIIKIFENKRLDAVFVEIYRGYMESNSTHKWDKK